jgi:hypothetical protein
MNKNKFSYEISKGSVSGDFNVFQARNGLIFLSMGRGQTPLSENQISILGIDVYSLIAFDYDLFKKAYEERG